MVEEGRWCVERVGQIRVIPALLGPAAYPAHPHRGVFEQPGQLGDLPRMVARGRAQQIAVCHGEARLVVVALVGHRALEIHRARQQVDRGDAVCQRVVHLADQRKAAAGQPFGEVKLPQRAAAVQRCGGHPSDDLVQFGPATGGGHLHTSQVVVQVDVAVLSPHRVVEPPWDVDELVAQRF